MSSEAETMMKKSKHTLTPKLRFPEFRDKPGWLERRLGSQGDFLSSLTGKTSKDFDTGDSKFIPYMNVFSNVFTDPNDLRAVSVESDESQNDVAKGDVFFTVSSETPDETGMSSVLLEDIENCYLNSFCALFRFDAGKSPDLVFLGYMLRSGIPREHLARSAQGSTRFNLSKGTFRDAPLLLPTSHEQQKIAECLSSLDGLITAEGRTLEALKAHKKGLMQQLFPQPGQTKPRLRFPEFRDKGEWGECKLGKLVDISSGKSPSQYVLSSDGIYPFVKVEDLNNCTKYQVNSREYCDDAGGVVPERSILFPKRGAAIELNKIRITAVEILIDTNLMAITPRDLATSEFLFYYLGHVGLSQIADTSSIPQINNKHIIPFNISAPSRPEQQRIADCLSTLDTRIAAQAGKIDSLKAHKRGLMQQLFPAPEEQ